MEYIVEPLGPFSRVIELVMLLSTFLKATKEVFTAAK